MVFFVQVCLHKRRDPENSSLTREDQVESMDKKADGWKKVFFFILPKVPQILDKTAHPPTFFFFK